MASPSSITFTSTVLLFTSLGVVEMEQNGPEIRKYDKNWPEKIAIRSQWKWRNGAIFNNISIPVELWLELLASEFKEQEMVWPNLQRAGQSCMTEIQIKWVRPPPLCETKH